MNIAGYYFLGSSRTISANRLNISPNKCSQKGAISGISNDINNIPTVRVTGKPMTNTDSCGAIRLSKPSDRLTISSRVITGSASLTPHQSSKRRRGPESENVKQKIWDTNFDGQCVDSDCEDLFYFFSIQDLFIYSLFKFIPLFSIHDFLFLKLSISVYFFSI